MQQKDEKWQHTLETAEQLIEKLKKQNRGAVSDRGETSRRAAIGIDIGDIYDGK